MQDIKRQKRILRMKIAYWKGKSEYNPAILDKAETEILKYKTELINLKRQI